MSQFNNTFAVVSADATDFLTGGGGNRPGPALAAAVDCAGRGYQGLEIDPRSGVLALACYFDQESEPTALLVGERIARPFRRLRIHTLFQCLLLGDQRVPGLPGGSTPNPAPTVNRQRVLLRLYDAPPPAGVGSGAKPVRLYSTQEVITVTGSHAEKGVLHVHAPGARTVRAWCSNRNTSNTGITTMRLVDVMPTPIEDAWPAGGDDYIERSIGTVTMAAATADGFRAVVLTETAPAASDFIVYVANSDAATFQVGIQVELAR